MQLSKYLLIILIAIYTYQCFSALKNKPEEKKKGIYRGQRFLMYLIHFIAFLVIYLNVGKDTILIFYGAQVLYFILVRTLYKILYKKASLLLLNNMSMLLCIGFIMLTRLSYTRSIRQFKIVVIATILTIWIPYFLRKMKFLKKLYWLYGSIGISLLAVVMVAGSTSYGAKLSLNLGGMSIQPSEFVKILFVWFIAGIFTVSVKFSRIVIATICAAAYVMVLVLSNDLGTALIFFLVYLVMLYVATNKSIYLFSGLLAGSGASVVAYHLFYHVQERVTAWMNPWSVIDNEGYQITQSLFAIGTGGWIGMGLFKGMPNTIPVVEQDFIFSAISEEMGGFFALFLIMICLSCFLLFIKTALEVNDIFYKLTALGLGITYGVQVFLTLGGTTKFIPSTGITLPLVSYGGSSIFSTLIIISIFQGLYLWRQDEVEVNEEEKTTL